MDSSQNRKVRVIAKIKGSSEFNALAPWIKVHKPEGDQSQSVSISFGDQTASRRETFEVDYCYEQSENNDLIFSREVKPLISHVFAGSNASVIACGARSSGKTYLIQGVDDEPGLAVLAMDEILSTATGNGKSIAISFYEVCQDRVFDLLDSKRPEVTVLEAQGKIQLRGICQVPIKSMEEFQKIYINSYKVENKSQNEPPNRSHRGLMVYIFGGTARSDNLLVGKMNFIDLAGYEDFRRKSGEGQSQVENSRINKSIYNLQNVIHALSSNESHVPYRETKLTHMLKDSLGGTSKILMVTCVNPSLCQDSLYMVKLASRCCSIILDSTKKTKCSSQNHSSLKNKIPGTPSSTVKKLAPSISSSQNSQTPGTIKTKTPIVYSSQKGQTASNMKNKIPLVYSSQKSHTPDPMKKMTPLVYSSQKSHTPGLVKKTTPVIFSSQNKNISRSVSTTMKKKTIPHIHFSANKMHGTASSIKRRDLFYHDGNLEKMEKTMEKESFTSNDASLSNDISTTQLPTQEEETSNVKTSDLVKVDVSPTILLHDSIPAPIEDESPCVLHDSDSSAIKHCEDTTCLSSATKSTSSGEEGQNIDKENDTSVLNVSAQLQKLSKVMSENMKIEVSKVSQVSSVSQVSYDLPEPKTPEHRMRIDNRWETSNVNCSPWETFSVRSSGMKQSLVQEYLKLINTGSKDELKRIKGIGEKRATYILDMREESPEPFKSLDDLKDIGLSAKQIKGLLKTGIEGILD